MIALRRMSVSKWQLGNSSFQPLQIHLGEGSVGQPDISLASMLSAVDGIVSAVANETEVLIVEADLVSPAALRVDPTSGGEISYIGSIPPQEIRSSISAAARQISGKIDRVLSGALGSYISSAQKSALSAQQARLGNIVSVLLSQDTASISSQNQGVVQDYLTAHLAGVDQAIATAEKDLVSAEAGSVPVLEPDEKNGPRNIAIGVGLVAVTGLVLWGVLG